MLHLFKIEYYDLISGFGKAGSASMSGLILSATRSSSSAHFGLYVYYVMSEVDQGFGGLLCQPLPLRDEYDPDSLEQCPYHQEGYLTCFPQIVVSSLSLIDRMRQDNDEEHDY